MGLSIVSLVRAHAGVFYRHTVVTRALQHMSTVKDNEH
jgi:hypothetical protein